MMQTPHPIHPYGCVMSDASSMAGQNFGRLIRDARTRLGWSQDVLVEKSGVSRSTISRWERGLDGKPEPSLVRDACLALGIDPRRAAVALGYLTEEELGAPVREPMPPTVEEIIEALTDPLVSEDDKRSLLSYLRWMRAQRQGVGRSAG